MVCGKTADITESSCWVAERSSRPAANGKLDRVGMEMKDAGTNRTSNIVDSGLVS